MQTFDTPLTGSNPTMEGNNLLMSNPLLRGGLQGQASNSGSSGAVKIDFDFLNLPQRANTAPLVPQTMIDEVVSPDDPRCTQDYADWYYSQVPRNPRALPPVGIYARPNDNKGAGITSPPGMAGKNLPQQRLPPGVAPPLPVDSSPTGVSSFNSRQSFPLQQNPPPSSFLMSQGLGGLGGPPMPGGFHPMSGGGGWPQGMGAGMGMSSGGMGPVGMGMGGGLSGFAPSFPPQHQMPYFQQSPGMPGLHGGFPQGPGPMSGMYSNPPVQHLGGGGHQSHPNSNYSHPSPYQHQQPPSRGERDRGETANDRGKAQRIAAPRATRRTNAQPGSALMEDFRSRRKASPSLADLNGHLKEFSKDQEGSRHIQSQLGSCTPEEKDSAFREIMAEFQELMSDVFANYVLQKLIEVSTPRQQAEVYETIQNNVLSMTLQTYGCRIVQKCLETFDQPMQEKITAELHGNVARCIQDQNGNHVIQKCIEIMPTRAGFIVDSFKGTVHDLATHAYGCRVIQRVLEFCPPEQQAIIFDELQQNIEALVCDQYGNYVIQHVLCHGTSEQRGTIIRLLTLSSFSLSTHKFASNVVEKMYEHSSPEQREAMLAALMQPTLDGCSGLLNMMKDQYANYVIQKIIDLSNDDQKRRVVEHIRPHVTTLRKFTYGKHIIARLERSSLLPNTGASAATSTSSNPSSPNARPRGFQSQEQPNLNQQSAGYGSSSPNPMSGVQPH